MITSLQEEAPNTDRKCPSCSKCFLRKGSLARHIGCKTCRRSENPREKHGEMEAALKAQAVGIAATTCNLGSERRKQSISKEEKLIDIWENDVKGIARKITNPKRKKGKFTEKQKQIMEKCFDEGEYDKKNRYTTSSCQKLMSEKLDISWY